MAGNKKHYYRGVHLANPQPARAGGLGGNRGPVATAHPLGVHRAHPSGVHRAPTAVAQAKPARQFAMPQNNGTAQRAQAVNRSQKFSVSNSGRTVQAKPATQHAMPTNTSTQQRAQAVNHSQKFFVSNSGRTVQAKPATQHTMPTKTSTQQKAQAVNHSQKFFVSNSGRTVQAKPATQHALPTNTSTQQRAQAVARHRVYGQAKMPPIIQAKARVQSPQIPDRESQRARSAQASPAQTGNRGQLSIQAKFPGTAFAQSPRSNVIQQTTKKKGRAEIDESLILPGRARASTTAVTKISETKASEPTETKGGGNPGGYKGRSVAPKDSFSPEQIEAIKTGTKGESHGYVTYTDTKNGQVYTRANIPGEDYFKKGSPHDLNLKFNIDQSKGWKDGLVRSHVKGRKDDKTATGIVPHYKEGLKRDSWKGDLINPAKDKLTEDLKKAGVSPATAGHYVEISHALATGNYGSYDMVNAFVASYHQNTEQLAVETAHRHVVSKKSGEDDMKGKQAEKYRLKITGYVHDQDSDLHGRLKYTRYKIYRKDGDDWNKVVDHLMDGERGDIDKDESQLLYGSIKRQMREGPALGKGGKILEKDADKTQKPKGISTVEPYTYSDLLRTMPMPKGKGKDRDDNITSAFTDLQMPGAGGERLLGKEGAKRMNKILLGHSDDEMSDDHHSDSGHSSSGYNSDSGHSSSGYDSGGSVDLKHTLMPKPKNTRKRVDPPASHINSGDLEHKPRPTKHARKQVRPSASLVNSGHAELKSKHVVTPRKGRKRPRK